MLTFNLSQIGAKVQKKMPNRKELGKFIYFHTKKTLQKPFLWHYQKRKVMRWYGVGPYLRIASRCFSVG